MKRLLLLACAIFLVAAPAWAQQWEYAGVFPSDTLETHGLGIHGIAVDGEGKVWIQPHAAHQPAGEVVFVPQLNEDRPSPVIYVFHPDGTQADFSPIRFIDYAAGTGLARDTLGGFLTRNTEGALVWNNALRTGRGLTTDHNGDIIASQGSMLFRFDHETGEGLARLDTRDRLDTRGITAPSTDADGNVYVTGVFPGDPIAMYDENFNFVENVVDADRGFSRTILALPDGTVLKFGYDLHYTTIYRRPDQFSSYDSVSVTFRGMDIESATINPLTGQVWVSAGSANDAPNRDPSVVTNFLSHTWYGFDVADLLTSETPEPRQSITWHGCVTFSEQGVCLDAPWATGRPRGIAFSPDGMTAYPAMFTIAAPNVQEFTFTGVSNEPGVDRGIVTLSPNYPNPFATSTTIEFSLEQAGHVSLRVYDVLGREVATLVNEMLPADSHTATLNAGGLASGTYIYVLEQDGQRLASSRMQVVR
jgi:hypothetical protein